MIDLTIKYGHCESTVFAAAAFAGALVKIMEDIDEGTSWGHTTLALMNMYDKEVLIPMIHPPIYGLVFIWKSK